MSQSFDDHSPWWLPGGHLQTIVPALFHRLGKTAFERQRVELPDGDFVDIDWLWPKHLPRHSIQSVLTMFHGLEGSSDSHYVRAMACAVDGMPVVLAMPHFRGCSGEPNRLPRAYHSGDAHEIALMLQLTRNHAMQVTGRQDLKFYAAGVSLGGNALLKWAGDMGQQAQQHVQAIAAVSAPLDLAAGGAALSRGFSRVYQHMFVRTLKQKALDKQRRFGDLFDTEKMQQVSSLYEFDNLFTAPIHGFLNTEDYWSRASAKPVLSEVAVPALVMNAQNDPFLPNAALPLPAQVSQSVQLSYPKFGGHVGFMTAPFPGAISWAPQAVTKFLFNH